MPALGLFTSRHLQQPLVHLRLVHNLEHTFGRRQGALNDVRNRRQLLNRHAERTGVLDERLNVAHRNQPQRALPRAHNAHGHIREVAHQHHGRAHNSGDELRQPRVAEVGLVHALELRHRRGLVAKRLHLGVAAIRLLDVRVQLPQRGLLRHEQALRAARNRHGDHQRQRHGGHRNQRHQRRNPQHHRQHAHEGDGRGQRLRDGILQRGGDEVHVVDHAREHVALGRAVVKRKRQPVEFALHLLAQRKHGVLRHLRHHVLLRVFENAVGRIHQQHGDEDELHLLDVDARAGLARRNRARPAIDERGGVAQNLGRHNVEQRGQQRERHGQRNQRNLRFHIFEEPEQRALCVAGVLRGRHLAGHGRRAGNRGSRRFGFHALFSHATPPPLLR